MPTTTNYGWTTPADTDLVKDGAAAIRTLGTAIDTTVFNNANAAIAKTIVDAKGDIIAATASDTVARLAVGSNEQRLVADSAQTSGLKYVADTTNYAIAAKGDLLVGTAADTLAALSVGANGYTLVADSAEATGLKWATASSGGMTLINTGGTTLTGASVTISSIPATYKNLELIVENYKPATNTSNLLARFNGDSGNNYATDEDGSAASFGNSSFYVSGQADSTNANGLNAVTIFNYTSSTWKCAFVTGLVNASATTFNSFTTLGVYKTGSAISSITLLPSSGNFTSGTAYLYGVS